MKLITLFEANVINTYIKKFSQQHETHRVKNIIHRFLQLKNNHRLKGPEKDLGSWLNKPFDDLYSYVTDMETSPSNKDIKRQDKNTAIKALDNDRFLIIIPLTRGSACAYGKDTAWCISSTKWGNDFSQYFNDARYTIFIVIDKENGEKYAILFYNHGNITVYDSSDDQINSEEFENETELSWSTFHYYYEKYEDTIRQYQSYKTEY